MRVMEWFSWLRGRRGAAPRPQFPAMFRVRDATGAPVPQVEMEGTFEPGGTPLRKRQVTASGLCLVHWPKRAERLVLTLRARGGSARLEVSSRRAQPDRVIEVALESA